MHLKSHFSKFGHALLKTYLSLSIYICMYTYDRHTIVHQCAMRVHSTVRSTVCMHHKAISRLANMCIYISTIYIHHIYIIYLYLADIANTNIQREIYVCISWPRRYQFLSALIVVVCVFYRIVSQRLAAGQNKSYRIVTYCCFIQCNRIVSYRLALFRV